MIGAQVDEALSGSSTTRWRTTAGSTRGGLVRRPSYPGGDAVAGAVVVEETTNAILSVRTRALETLFTHSAGGAYSGTLTLFVFATRLSTRIRRLRDEAEEAVDAQGRVRGGIAASRARDEIGDLSRSLSTMVKRLGEYNDYLESMGGRLAHEIRTPIAVVRSSLDNLALQPVPDDAKRYMDRAREGLGAPVAYRCEHDGSHAAGADAAAGRGGEVRSDRGGIRLRQRLSAGLCAHYIRAAWFRASR